MELTMEVSIVNDTTAEPEAAYQVWAQPVDEGLPPWHSLNSFIMGSFPTFDAATAAVIKIQGVRMVINTAHLQRYGRASNQ